MPGPTSLRDALSAASPAAAVNDYLRALVTAADATCHCWFRGDRLSLRPALPRRKGVSASALEEWQRLLDCCSRLPHDLRRLQHDEDSVRLLHRLATHPADAVRFPAALALAVVPLTPVCGMKALFFLARLTRLLFYATILATGKQAAGGDHDAGHR